MNELLIENLDRELSLSDSQKLRGGSIPGDAVLYWLQMKQRAKNKLYLMSVARKLERILRT